MGLLDVLNSEQGRLGLGLLAAAGGRSDGAGFGTFASFELAAQPVPFASVHVILLLDAV